MIATMVQGSAQAVNPSNKPTFASLLADATKLGGEVGAGSDGYVKLLIRTMEASYHGAVDLESANKHGKGQDDIFVVVAAYAKARGISSNFKGKAANERKLMSNCRKGGKLGQMTTLGPGQPIGNVGDLMIRRNKRFQVDPKTTEDAANCFLKYATAQLKQTALIEGDALDQFCRKNEQAEKTPKAILKGVKKTLEKLGDGSQEIKDATVNIIRRINAITLSEVAAAQKAKGV